MPWSLRAQGSGTLHIKRQRTPRDRERDVTRAKTSERGYGTEWQRIRRKIVLRDNKRCTLCGDDGYLVVHHIDHDPSNNAWENLQTMCRPCHERHHGRAR